MARDIKRRAATAAAAVLAASAIAFVLLSELRPSFFAQSFLPVTGFAAEEQLQNGSDDSSDDRFALNPLDHVFRNATTWIYEWRITSAHLLPDGVLKDIDLLNGLFPGPTLEGRSGGRLVVHVENALEDADLSIHWHGLTMRDENAMDGAVGITQSPIQPGQTCTYNFTIELNQKGTFWYHAHSGVQRADGLYGGLVIHEPRPASSAEDVGSQHLLLLADKALTAYMHPGAFGLETVPDSALVNGVGAFTCSDAVPSRPIDCLQRRPHELSVLRLDATKRNVIRVVNVGAYSGISIAIEGATLMPVHVDGGHAVPEAQSRSAGVLHVGERIDLLALPEATHSNVRSRLTVTLDEHAYKYQNPALTAAHHFPVQWHGVAAAPAREHANTTDHCDIASLKSAHNQSTFVPPEADQTLVLPQTSPLFAVSRDAWDQNQFVPWIKYNKYKSVWVDVVPNDLEESHPFHLHGHEFWVLSKYTSTSNWGSYNPFDEDRPPGGPYELPSALEKDTVLIPRRGYAVLRFRADNPGIWMLHCHMLWHQGSGMAMALEIGP